MYIYYVIKNKQTMNIQFKLNILNLLGAFFFGFITYTILTGKALEYVHFAGPLNELFCAVATMMLTIMMLITSFEKIRK